MTKVTAEVIERIRRAMLPEIAKVSQVSFPVAEEVASHMRLGMNWGEITTCFEKPMLDSGLQRLALELEKRPEMKDDEIDSILDWIRHHCVNKDDVDWLGSYTPHQERVDLYWLSIILCARENAWAIPDLAQVVLVHEYAHACTHLGVDADFTGWRGADFGGQPVAIIEGIAQYYTQYVLSSRDSYRNWLSVFDDLMARQPPQYRAHLPWLDESTAEMCKTRYAESLPPWPMRERVRIGLIMVRRDINRPKTADDFTLLIDPRVADVDRSVQIF